MVRAKPRFVAVLCPALSLLVCGACGELVSPCGVRLTMGASWSVLRVVSAFNPIAKAAEE